MRIRAEGKGSGAPIDQRFGHLFTIRDGMLVSLEWFRDPRSTFEAAERGGPAAP